jgi:hypothetical protein
LDGKNLIAAGCRFVFRREASRVAIHEYGRLCALITKQRLSEADCHEDNFMELFEPKAALKDTVSRPNPCFLLILPLFPIFARPLAFCPAMFSDGRV